MSPIDRIPVVDTLTPLVVGILTSAPRLTRTDTALAFHCAHSAGPGSLWSLYPDSTPCILSQRRQCVKAAICEAKIVHDQERERGKERKRRQE